MKTSWIIGLISIAGLALLNLKKPQKGSENSDLNSDLQPGRNPLPPCPESPNCIRLSFKLDTQPRILFDTLPLVLEKMKAEEIEINSQTLQIDAVFRIPVFGFHDDFTIRIEPGKEGGPILHLSSRSRVGRGDLGVNRRRVKTFFRILNSYLN